MTLLLRRPVAWGFSAVAPDSAVSVVCPVSLVVMVSFIDASVPMRVPLSGQ